MHGRRSARRQYGGEHAAEAQGARALVSRITVQTYQLARTLVEAGVGMTVVDPFTAASADTQPSVRLRPLAPHDSACSLYLLTAANAPLGADRAPPGEAHLGEAANEEPFTPDVMIDPVRIDVPRHPPALPPRWPRLRHGVEVDLRYATARQLRRPQPSTAAWTAAYLRREAADALENAAAWLATHAARATACWCWMRCARSACRSCLWNELQGHAADAVSGQRPSEAPSTASAWRWT